MRRLQVSVPRRGFIVFLHELDTITTQDLADKRFQSPEGDSLFFYLNPDARRSTYWAGFSPPKGIHCFSTLSRVSQLS